ncbi:HsdM family class I SAM-dependent methyltransferase [Candidatus Pyrohabitans sp.]
MDSATTFETLCKVLGFNESPGLLTSEDVPSATVDQARILRESKEKFGIDAIYFVQVAPKAVSIPVIYFKRLESPDPDLLRDLHRRIWNLGKVPLLFVILPGEIKIYNCFAPPPEKPEEDLDSETRLLKSLSTLTNIQKELRDYSRQEIDTGNYWRKNWKKFNIENRVDNHLLKNLRVVCDIMHRRGLEYKCVHSLLGRSIFILYLQDRKALNDFFKKFENGKFSKFTDILPNKELTYRFFKKINKHFNGDMFPVTPEEERLVTEEHLKPLREFLLGTDLETGQRRLWPYSFDVIPIEFISNIYEEFFHHDNNKETKLKKGTHYTPQFLVEFILNEILPWDGEETNVKVLDPACGSGIFLVEAYKRLIERWKRVNGKDNVDFSTLVDIIKKNIFGVDINEEAIRIAAFSLYLTMLDYLEPKSIWQNVKFPILLNENLFAEDFFDEDAPFNKHKYDIIVGNPPWGSIPSENSLALSYCRNRNRPIGNKQIAQAFIWRASDLCAKNGEICLLVTAKGLLFNRSDKNREFRRAFLKNFEVRTIVNLSVLRHQIFDKSVGPPAIVFFKPKQNNDIQKRPILYVVPKISIESKQLGAIVIDPSNLIYLPATKVFEDDTLWKVAMWGTPRDAILISKCREKGTLKDFIEKMKWEFGDGFQANGSDRNFAPWLKNLPFLPTKYLKRFYIPYNTLRPLNRDVFHRPKTKNRFTAPLCLVKVTLNKGQVVAAYSGFNICYTDGIIGISGHKKDISISDHKKNAEMLKILTCYLNFNLARYFLFLTASVWGVERDDILKIDFENIPFIMPEVNSKYYKELVKIYDEIANLHGLSIEQEKKFIEKIDKIFFELFSLSETDKVLIHDTLKYTINQFYKKEDSIAYFPVTKDILCDYAIAYCDVFNTFLAHQKKSLDITVYYEEAMPLQVVSFTLKKTFEHPKIEVKEASDDLQKILSRLDRLLIEQRSPGIYVRRNVRIYDNNTIYIVKSNEIRYWTRSIAFNDADETLADIFEKWKEMR